MGSSFIDSINEAMILRHPFRNLLLFQQISFVAMGFVALLLIMKGLVIFLFLLIFILVSNLLSESMMSFHLNNFEFAWKQMIRTIVLVIIAIFILLKI